MRLPESSRIPFTNNWNVESGSGAPNTAFSGNCACSGVKIDVGCVRKVFSEIPDGNAGLYLPRTRCPALWGHQTLTDLLSQEGSQFTYEYDFGDNWQHVLLVEKIQPAEEGMLYPICLEGAGACPPKDVGGIPGYEHFLDAIREPTHPEHQDLLEWIGGNFDPEKFDLDKVNRTLRRSR